MNSRVTDDKSTHSPLDFGRALALLRNPEWRAKSLSTIFYCVLLAIFIVSIYATISDKFWLRFLQARTEGLTQIAQVTAESGASSRKTSVDSLWLPIFHTMAVYDSDILSTEKDSFVEIELKKDIRFTVEPKSLVHIKMIEGKPLLRLSKGEIKTNFVNDEVVLIKKGTHIEEVLIRKGTYLIKNDLSAGIQITSYIQEVKSTAGLTEQTRTKAKLSNSEEDEASDSKPHKPAETKESPHETIYDLPTPADGTLFLLKSPLKLSIGAKAKCTDSCILQIYRDQNEIKTIKLQAGETAVAQLEEKEIVPGEYSWRYSSQVFEFSAAFSVQPFNDQTLENAIHSGRPLEVLGE